MPDNYRSRYEMHIHALEGSSARRFPPGPFFSISFFDWCRPTPSAALRAVQEGVGGMRKHRSSQPLGRAVTGLLPGSLNEYELDLLRQRSLAARVNSS